MKKWIKLISISAAGIILLISIVSFAVVYTKFFSTLTEAKKEITPILFYNGNIITVDPLNPKVEAVLVDGETIRFAGSYKEALALASKNTKMIDLKKKTLIPGFNDNHVHSLVAGSFYSQLMLWGLTCEEIADLVKKEAAGKKKGDPVYGNLWDYTTCKNPHKALLDKAAPDNPVFLIQFSGHAAWTNSSQLKLMKIDRNTPDPMGGRIVRDADNEPTGILRDTAMGSVADGKYIKILLDSELHKKIIVKILGLYKKAGITSVHDNTWEPFTVRLLQKLHADNVLTARFSCWSQGGTAFFTVFNLLTSFKKDDKWIYHDVIKYYTDGAFSTRTAWLIEPYNNDPENIGKPRYTKAELDEIVMNAAKDRKRLAIHALGDRAVTEVLNAIEKAQQKYPWTKDLRFRLEHIQLVAPDDIPRMKKLGIVACLQPFALCTPLKDIQILGKKRAKSAYPYKSLYKAGIPVSFGSDAPAEVDFEPLLGIYYAVTRKDKKGKEGPLNERESYTPYEALYSYTMGSAYAEFLENKKGSITKGKLSDLVILSDDILSVKKEKIKDIKVLMTIAGGRIVFGDPSGL